MMQDVIATQRARAFAAHTAEKAGKPMVAKQILEGGADQNWRVKLFARFQAEIEAATIERSAKDMAQLKAENERLSKHIASGVLPGLLDDDEKDALLDFVKHLRNLKGQTS